MAFPKIDKYEWVCVDTETDGVEWMHGHKPFSMSVTLPDGYSEYYDFRLQPAALEWARKELPTANKVVNHNIKFDIHMLRNIGVALNPAKCECTMVRAALIDEHLREYSLDALAKRYLKKEKYNDIYEQLAKMFGGRATRSVQAPNFVRAPASLMRRYAIPDTELAAELWLWQNAEIDRQDLHQVWALEQRLFPHIVENERLGICVSEERAHQTVERLTEKAEAYQKELDRIAGFKVNPNPSQSIHNLFQPKQNVKDDGTWEPSDGWVTNDGTIIGSTGAGKASINADALKSMSHPAAKLILTYRKLLKTRDTFVGGHILGNVVNGKVHPNINQTKGEQGDNDGGVEGTGTGRLSYTRPALQQIPSRDKEIAEIVRPIFIPDEGQKWSYGDLDQHEFRIFAHYARPERLLAEYAANPDLDMHQIVADLTGLPRSAPSSGGANAKQINLAMVFNMGGGELASQMKLPYYWDTAKFKGEREPRKFKKAGVEAQEVMERYYREIPGVREVAKKASSLATARGYVMTMRGRHIRFPGGLFAYKASGLIYQGTAADFNKENFCLISEYLMSECPHNRLLLNIHDEYSMSLLDEGDITVKHLKEIKGLIEDKGLRVPIRIDFSGLAPNWWEATKTPTVTK